VGNTDKGLRTFRLDRVQSLALTDEIVERPAGFDLASAWRDVLVAVGERRTSVRATVRIAPRHLRGLRGQFGTDMLMAELDEPPDDDGRVKVVVGGPAAIIVAQHLCAWARSWRSSSRRRSSTTSPGWPVRSSPPTAHRPVGQRPERTNSYGSSDSCASLR
jgi:hypothetical protein